MKQVWNWIKIFPFFAV